MTRLVSHCVLDHRRRTDSSPWQALASPQSEANKAACEEVLQTEYGDASTGAAAYVFDSWAHVGELADARSPVARASRVQQARDFVLQLPTRRSLGSAQAQLRTVGASNPGQPFEEGGAVVAWHGSAGIDLT